RQAVYTEDRLKEVSPERRRRFFTRLPDGRWQVNERVRRYATFAQHNLLEDPYPQDQHLILCRNVSIYVTEKAKKEIFAKMAAGLASGGYLLVGSTETIFYPERYGLKSAAPFLYVREEEECGGSTSATRRPESCWRALCLASGAGRAWRRG